MTRLEVIEMIGDVITDVDIARGSLMPDAPERHQLDDLRLLLDDRQRKLSQLVFDENTKAFTDAAARLKSVNDQIQGTINKVDDMVTLLTNVQRFLDAATSLMKVAAAVR